MLHKHVGDTVIVELRDPQGRPDLHPADPAADRRHRDIPGGGVRQLRRRPHLDGHRGALLRRALPAAFQRAMQQPGPEPQRPGTGLRAACAAGVSAAAGRADLQRIADGGEQGLCRRPNAVGNNVAVLGVQRPAQIVNYRSIGSTPVILAVGLALGAIVALALTLVASVRRRRRDLALLKALGFTPRQLAAVVAWQATVTAVVGVVVGVPVGIVIGRQLWTLFARNINAVPDPTVPVLSVVLVALGALVFANVVAAIPGRIAARTPTALVLRAE